MDSNAVLSLKAIVKLLDRKKRFQPLDETDEAILRNCNDALSENYDDRPDGMAFLGDEAVPKSYIRKVYKDILDNLENDAEARLRAGEALAKLEGYVGPNQSKLDKLKIGVNIIQASSLKTAIPMPELPKLKDARREGQP